MSGMSEQNVTIQRHRPAIEHHSIDYIPKAERGGKIWHQGPFWFGGNFNLVTMIIGFTGPSLGLSVGWSVIAAILGAGFGTFFMAFHANQGPHFGLPQMIQSRAQFGMRGAVIPFAAAVFVYVGLLILDIVFASQGAKILVGGDNWFWYPVIAISSILLAVFGHDLIHVFQRWLAYFLIISFGIITIIALTSLEPSGESYSSGRWVTSAFLAQFGVAAGYNISYAIYVSDYSRYLPETTPAPKMIFWTYIGAWFSAGWLMSLGALLAGRMGDIDAFPAVRELGDNFFPGFGWIVVLLATLAFISIMGINAYGAMLTSVSAIDGFKETKPTIRLRIIGLAIIGTIALVFAFAIPEDYLSSLNNIIILFLYFLVPWTAINLVDFYIVRRGQYSIIDMFDKHGIYGQWSWRGVTAYLVGFIAMTPFFVTSFYTGFVASLLNGTDIAFAIGLPVSGGLYYLFCRNIDFPSVESEACLRSERELEG